MKFYRSKKLIEYFIKGSPRNKIKSYNQVLPFNQIQTEHLPSNLDYVNFFLADIGCQHLLISKTINQNYGSTPLTTVAKKQLSKKAILISLMKDIDRGNVDKIKYVEMEEFVNFIKNQQAAQLKKQLLYLYKILRQKLSPSSVTKQLNSSLIRVILKKMYDGGLHQLQNTKKQVQYSLESLIKQARQKKQIGDAQLARQKYQGIYNHKNAKDNYKKEALDYLCEKGRQKGDLNYLNQIMERAKQKGQSKDYQYVWNVIKSLKQTYPDLYLDKKQ